MSTKTAAQSSLLPSWMRHSLEHFNSKTNLEEFGTSPPENESVFLHEPLHHYSLSNLIENTSPTTASTPSMVFKAKELKPRSGRQHHLQYLQQDQVCPSMGGTLSEAGSAANTPCVTPQQSPTLIRKILAAEIAGSATYCKAGNSILDGAKLAKCVPVTRVTNFDLNAVSPTSW